MKESLLALLVCPRDGGHPLRAVAVRSGAGGIEEGELACPSCERRFPISAGIPRFVPPEHDDLSEISRREMEIRDSKRAQRVTPDLSVDRVLELDAIRTAIGDCRGSRVLDAGCGVGHMTRAVEESASVVAVDFSWEGLVRFQFRGSADLARVQADVAHLPLRGGVFDLALSSQVLEHLPADGRDAFLAHLARVLKPDGRLVLTAYNWDRGRQGAGVPKEGFHSSGIFYHCFEPQELREALSRHFAIDAIWGTQADMPGMFRILRLLGRRRLPWDRRWRQRPAALPYSPVLLATGRRRGDGH